MLRQDAKLSPLTWPLFPDSCPDLYNVKNKEKSETEYYIFSETAKENSVYFATKSFFGRS